MSNIAEASAECKVSRIPHSRLRALTANVNLPFVPGNRLRPRDTEWLWWPRIPCGHLTLLGAQPKVGKGLVMADIAARVTTGAPWPDGEGYAPKGRVLWAESEDDLEATVVPRLIAASADLCMVELRDARDLPLDWMRQQVETGGVKLIVLSSLKDFLSGLGVKPNKDNDIEVRGMLYKLRDIVWHQPCALVGIGHLNKKPDLGAFDRFSGSGAYVQVGRSFIGMQRDDQNERRGPRRLVLVGCNLGNDTCDDLLATPVHKGKPGRHPIDPKDPYVALNWDVAETNIAPSKAFDQNGERRQSAGAWLRHFLLQRGGKVLKETVVIPAAQIAGHSRDAIEKAFDRDGGKTLKWEKDPEGRSLWWFEGQPAEGECRGAGASERTDKTDSGAAGPTRTDINPL